LNLPFVESAQQKLKDEISIHQPYKIYPGTIPIEDEVHVKNIT